MKSLAVLAIVAGCSTSPYRFYSMDLSQVSQEKATTVEMYAYGEYDDLDGRECWHPDGTAGRCACAETAENRVFKQDYVETKVRLNRCEGGDDQPLVFPYRHYGTDFSALTLKEAKDIDLYSLNKTHQNITALDCYTAEGVNPICDCYLNEDGLAALAEHEANQKRLERCDDARAKENE
jgi:hypothetical protein